MEKLFTILADFVHKVPLPIYTSIGGLIEEVVAPVPSPLIMTSAGGFAKDQGFLPFYIAVISLYAAIGKTIGALLIYFVSDKAEDLVLIKFGKFFGVTHKQVEKLGKKFDKTWKDDLLLIFLRALPVLPGAPVAIVAGIIKLNLRTYIVSTLIGVWLRSMIFGYTGYYGISQLGRLIASLDSIVNVILVIGALIFAGYFAYKKKEKLEKIVLKALDKKK
ncbi:VTT domain-containing protein [Candidatus Woesebacteria bacterium]|nr:VTT domain-containing protein [Candidatus Woesebacteria bacterium]